MTFRLALSGLNAAQADLGVTANNIANSSTNGFKRSRAEFSELFAVSPQGVSSLAAGNGVKVSDISQQFSQGSIDFTDNNLDLAISGPGFFTLSDSGAQVYTRAGSFKTDSGGYVVNSQGQRLQVIGHPLTIAKGRAAAAYRVARAGWAVRHRVARLRWPACRSPSITPTPPSTLTSGHAPPSTSGSSPSCAACSRSPRRDGPCARPPRRSRP